MTTPPGPEERRPPEEAAADGAPRPADHLTKSRLVLRRLAKDRTLLLSVFISIIVATTLSSGAPIYLASLEQLAFNISLDRTSSRFMNIHVLAHDILLSKRSLAEADARLLEAIDAHIAPIYGGQERYLRGGLQLVGQPEHPLPLEGVPGPEVTRGFLQSLSNLGPQSRILQGTMATSVVGRGPLGPELEAVVGEKTFERFELELGLVLTLTPVLESSKRMSVRIVGVIEPADLKSDYWRFAGVYIEPALLQSNIPVGLEFLGDTFDDLPEVRTLPLFVTEGAMIEAIGLAYPGALVKPNWFILLDKDRLKDWSVSESGRRLRGFEDSLVESMPGSAITTRAVRGLIDDLERRSLLALMPMLVLMVVALATILFYMAMMVSYVVRSRERDAALLRTRGANIFEILKLYAIEGLAMTGAAVLTAPFLAMAIVALSGKLPYFHDLTGGELLPVRWGVWPFVAAAGAGLLCLFILVIPGTAGARMGLLVHKMRSSRPPALPFFHRYYLDIALLTFGGLTFWELNARGNLVTGGLFKDVQINETLLLAPVLFLVVVALLFLRFFPLLVRFISGESPALAHLLAAAAILVLAPGIAYVAITGEGGEAWAGSVALLLALGAVYWATNRASHLAMRAVGLAVQAALVGGVIALHPLGRDEVLYPAVVGLIAIVPVQIAFILLRGTMKIVPIWLSMALLHMARNPLQYAWLILLLVLATGLGVLATTVGGTLEASQIDRVRYEVATDLRVAGFTSHRAGSLKGLLEAYGSTPGIASVSLGYRDDGTIGPAPFEVLGLDPDVFSDISWYRDDFSELSLSEVMARLGSNERLERVPLPAEAVEIGAWIKPLVSHPEMQLWALITDQAGELTSIKLGEPRSGEWQLMRGEIPSHVRPPLFLIAIQVTEPAFFYGLESPGAFLVDDIHVTASTTTDEIIIVEDFEGEARWEPIITEELSSDLFAVIDEDVFNGERAGTFVFGSETNQGYRGIYKSPTRGPASVVVSSELLAAIGGKIGDPYVAAISGRRVPVIIRGVVDYFPTLSPRGGRFLLIDMVSLLRHLNVLSSAVDSEPNELFVTSSSSDHQSLRSAVDELVGRDGVVVDGVEKLETIRLDPLVTAGWRPIVLITPVIVVLVVAFGYLAYLLLFAAHNESEVGILKTFGLSRLQLLGLTGFEHLTIGSVGLALGTWAGFQASKLIVDPLVITETGEQVVPPYILLTSWNLMGPTYATLGVVLVGMLFVLVRTLSRVDLTHITRVEAN